MEHQVGVRELKQQTSAVLRRVIAGEVIQVTDHGRPVARIVPLRAGMLDQLVVEGRAIASSGDLRQLMDQLDLPAQPGTDRISASEALAELRAGER